MAEERLRGSTKRRDAAEAEPRHYDETVEVGDRHAVLTQQRAGYRLRRVELRGQGRLAALYQGIDAAFSERWWNAPMYEEILVGVQLRVVVEEADASSRVVFTFARMPEVSEDELKEVVERVWDGTLGVAKRAMRELALDWYARGLRDAGVKS